MAAIANDWLVPMSGEFKKPYYRKLYETVKSEYETKEVYPAPDDIFNAFAFPRHPPQQQPVPLLKQQRLPPMRYPRTQSPRIRHSAAVSRSAQATAKQ